MSTSHAGADRGGGDPAPLLPPPRLRQVRGRVRPGQEMKGMKKKEKNEKVLKRYGKTQKNRNQLFYFFRLWSNLYYLQPLERRD